MGIDPPAVCQYWAKLSWFLSSRRAGLLHQPTHIPTMLPDFKTIHEFTLAAVLGGLAVALGIAMERNRLQAEAIAHGAANWIVTPSGATEFTWKANFTER